MARQLPEWIIPFLLFSGVIAAARLYTFHEPLERDITTYAVIGHELLRGRALYSDLWDHKPPAIHVTFALAEMIAGYGPGAIYLLGVAAAIMTLFGVMSAAAVMGKRASWWAGTFWVVVSCDMMLQANQPNSEVFINASLVLGFALLVRTPGKLHWPGSAWGIGGLYALATLYKPVALAAASLLLAAHVGVASSDGVDRRTRLHHALVVLSAIAAAWIVVVGHFALSGTFQPFWDAVILYNRSYQARGWELVGGITQGLVPSPTWFLAPLFALTAFGGALGIRRGDQRLWLLLAAYLVGTLVSIVLPGHQHPHYFQLWFPAACVGAGWGVETLMQRQPQLAWMCGLAALAASLTHEIPNFSLTPDQWSESKYGTTGKYGTVFVAARDLAPRIDALLLPNETFYEFGDETGFYFLTRRRPPSGVLYVSPLFDGPLVTTLSSQLIADLTRERPELVIVNGAYTETEDNKILIPNQPALLAILHDYELRWIVNGSPTFFLLTRKGGALEARVNQSPQAPQFRIFEQ